MEKITEDAIKSVVAVIIGIAAIFWLKQMLAGIILVSIGLILAGMNEALRGIIISLIKLLWEKATGKESQHIENSPGAIQQRANRDAKIGQVVNAENMVQNINIRNPTKNKTKNRKKQR